MEIKEAVLHFQEVLEKEGIIRVITHIDTDGITSAAILIHALKKLDQQFLVTCVKQLEEEYIRKLYEEVKKKNWKAIFFLDLGSGALSKLVKFSEYTKTIILDHHELQEKFIIEKALEDLHNENFLFVNPFSESLSASCITYLFAKELDPSNEELAPFAVLGLIGDLLDKTIDKTNNTIIEDAKKHGLQVKKGIKIFPSTRAIHKALEFGSNVFIPGVTGTSEGALAFLEELEIEVRDKSRKSYRTLLDLSKEELSKLITALTLKINLKTEELIGNVYLIKIFGRLYDARELSAMINACGRLGHGSIALAFLFNSKDAREKVERVYSEYKHHLIDGLNFVAFAKKREGNNYIIIDAENKIKDTIIGSVMSIIANSFVYPDGTILVGIADREEKAKISMRICGKNVNSVNLYSLLNSVVQLVGGECGGHKNAAGALIPKKKKEEFKSLLEKALQIGEIKIKI